MYRLIRPLLFRLDPETAHGLTLRLVGMAGKVAPTRWLLQAMFEAPDKPVEVFGLRFKNPMGLAAGYDKDGIAVRGLAALGFGHVEIGTVTPLPQAGNPKPRVYRLVEDEAVINRMGFPGRGMEAVRVELERVRKWRGKINDSNGISTDLVVDKGGDCFVGNSTLLVPKEPGQAMTDGEGIAPSGKERLPRNDVIVGVNLGKNKDTPIDKAAEDYLVLLHTFLPLADYLAINISSPNTVGLRRLQGREMLEELLGAIARERKQMMEVNGRWKPVLVKLAPDLSEEELEDALGVIVDQGMDGVIATNTTLGREGLRSTLQGESGGLSGSPLRGRSEEMLKKTAKHLNGRLPIISAGGIMNPEEAKRRLELGAALVQVYTGLIYAGPGLVKEIVKSL
jgi:dihydroorotate dehydrogenase